MELKNSFVESDFTSQSIEKKKVLKENLDELIKMYEEQISELLADKIKLQDENTNLTLRIMKLEGRLKELNQVV